MATARSNEAICSLVEYWPLQLEGRSDPLYTGVVISADKLMVLDFTEWKLHSRHDGKLQAIAHLEESIPRGMCLISKTEVAVYLDNSTIEIMSFKSTRRIRLVNTLHVKTGFIRCDAVAKVESMDKLIVSGWKWDKSYNGSLYMCVVSLTDGHVDTIHQVCKEDSKHSPLVSYSEGRLIIGDVSGRSRHASRLAIKNNTVYISCYDGPDSPNTGVYSYSIPNPNIRKFVYHHSDLKQPWGLTVDTRGYIFVCNWFPYYSIHQLTDRGELVTIHRLSSLPRDIFYEEQDGVLYITGLSSNVITRYRLKYSHQQDTVIPAEVLKMDKKSLDMYKDALRDGKEKVYSVRVMVVGQYGVGKTTLTRRLLGKDVKISDRDSTEGIDVHTECCKVSLATGEWTTQEKKVLKMDKRFLDMYKDALRDGKEKVYSVRVMVVGQYGVGKTTLTRHLLGKDVKISDRDSTEGIDVHTECCKVSLATGEWTTQEKNAEQYSRLQRLVKLLNERVEKQESEGEQEGQSEMDDLVTSEEHDNGHPQHDQPVSAEQDINQEVKLTLSQSVETPVVRVDPEPSSEIGSKENEKKKDAVMEILQLVNENSGKLDKSMVEYAALALWDFAGHYVFYTTHQTFLTSRAVYLLVIDLSQQVTDFIEDDECFLDTKGIKLCKVHELIEIWLNSIHSCAPSPQDGIPPVILVGTHVDKIPEVVPLSLVEEINRSGSVRIEDRDELDLFLRFQHEMGTILYFSVEGLREKIMLDPQWMINAVKSLITAETFIRRNPAITTKWLEFKKRGKLTHELLDAIWSKEKSPEFHDNKDHIILLMEKLNIIARPRTYEQDGKEVKVENYFLAPCMLSETTPQEIISPKPRKEVESSSVLSYVFIEKYLPSPIFHRLIAACVAHWPVAQKNSEYLIFCGCCVFHLDLHHRLTMFFREHVIFLRVTRMGTTKEIPSPKLCTEVKEFITMTLSNVIGYLEQNLQFELCIQCPKSDGDSVNSLIPVSDLQGNEDVPCHVHDVSHVIMSSEVLKFWFREEASQGKTGGDTGAHAIYAVDLPKTQTNWKFWQTNWRFWQFWQTNWRFWNIDWRFWRWIMKKERVDADKQKQKMSSVEKIYSGVSDLTTPEESQMSSQRRALPLGKKYHAFFSYSSSDIDWVRRTVKTLEDDLGFICREYDRDNTPGTPLLTFADDSVRNAYKTVVVMTREAFQSGFVLHEIQMAMNLGFKEFRNCVVPVLLEDCEVPSFMGVVNYVDARDTKRRDIWWPKLLTELETQGTLGSTTNESVMEEKQPARDINDVMQICIPSREQSQTSSLNAHTSDQCSIHSNPENTDIQDQIMSQHHDVRARPMNLQRKLYQTKGVSCSDPKLLCQVLSKSMQVASYSQSTLKGNCLTAGLKFHGETPANGNCFFEAVSSQLQRVNYAVQKSPQQLRQDVVAFMKANRILHVYEGTIDFAEFMGNETFDDYCVRMANDGEWADHVVVVAMARKLQTDIMIITSSPSSGPDDNIVWVVGQTDFQGQPILLGHVWEYHYQSLQPIASVSLEPVLAGSPAPAPTDVPTQAQKLAFTPDATAGSMSSPAALHTLAITSGTMLVSTYDPMPSITADVMQAPSSSSTTASLMQVPTYGSTQSTTTGPMLFTIFSTTTADVMQTVTSSFTTANVMQTPAYSYTPSTTAGPIPVPTSTFTPSTTAGHMQSATSISTSSGLMPARTSSSIQSTTTGSMPSLTSTSTPSTTAGHMQGATSTSTAAGRLPAPTYGSTQSMTTGPMPFPTFSVTTANVMQTVTSSTTTADIMQYPASGYTPSTTASPIPAPTTTSTPSPTDGHTQSATSTSTVAGLLPAPTYGSTQTKTTGPMPFPTFSATTADIMQYPASGYTPSTTAGPIPAPTSTSTPSTTAGHMQGATSTSTAAGLVPAPTYGSTQSMTTGPMPFPTFSATTANVMQTVTSSTTTAGIMQYPASGYTPFTTASPIPAPTTTSTQSPTAGHMQSATSTSTAAGLMPAPTYRSTQSMTTGPMPFPTFSATTANIVQYPASGYISSTTAGPIPAPTSTSMPSPTAGHMQSATFTSTAAGLMPAPTSCSTPSTTVGPMPAPTSSSTTADVMQAPTVDDADRFMHIACLLVNVGSRVLRRLLLHHTVTPTCTLDQYLAKNRIAIDSLKKRRILNNSQMDILFPPGGTTNLGDYDITLLSALFNNIVSTITQQQLNMIQFLRDERNEIFAHAKSITVNINDYQKFWNGIYTSLVALCKQCGDPDFENEILKEIQGIQMSTVQGTSFLDTLQTHPRRLETLERLVQALISGFTQESTKPSDDSDS